MLGYRVSLLVVSALSIGPGLFFVLIPEATSEELMRAQAVNLESFGEGFAVGQTFLVRLLGCWVLGFGLLSYFLSHVPDQVSQSIVLKGMILASLLTALGSIASPAGWVSLILSGLVLVVLVTARLRHQFGESDSAK